ncbi:hypothetical protein ABH994_000625 [Bradyrhizobium yuanmingense]|uniref:Uncharacterized protein n=1 Tax=Bradyrhizobium yuanmingense TaxID=108015 RepID=A0ABV4GF55_9BRAD
MCEDCHGKPDARVLVSGETMKLGISLCRAKF